MKETRTPSPAPSLSTPEPERMGAQDAAAAGALELHNPLWDFSVAIYATEGIAPECLALQDEYGLDVNLLTSAAWLGSLGIGLDSEGCLSMREATAEWQSHAVIMLRDVRRHLKPRERDPTLGPFRKKVQNLELEAEQIEQAMLHAWAARRWDTGMAGGSPIVGQNLGTLLETLTACGPAERQRVGTLFERAAMLISGRRS